MEDQLNRQEKEEKDRNRETRRDRRVEWAKVIATTLDAVAHFLRP